MIFSANNMFSDQQAITGSAASTNQIDLGSFDAPVGGNALARDLGKGNPISLLIQATADFNTLTSLTIAVECDDNAAFTSAKVVASDSMTLAELVAGGQSNLQYVPNGVDERYMRINYTVVGTDPTAGAITAGITMGNQTA